MATYDTKSHIVKCNLNLNGSKRPLMTTDGPDGLEMSFRILDSRLLLGIVTIPASLLFWTRTKNSEKCQLF